MLTFQSWKLGVEGELSQRSGDILAVVVAVHGSKA